MKQDGLVKMKPERLILNIKSDIFMLQQPTNSFILKIKKKDSKYITIKIVSSLDKSPTTG